MVHRIDGKLIAMHLREDSASKVDHLKNHHNLTPGLAVVLVGDNPASQVYVRNKVAQTTQAGMTSYSHRLDDSVSEQEILDLVESLNKNPAVHGILVQLPLPEQINPDNVIGTIDPQKDVDGFHIINAGRLAVGLEGLVPCTPLGCIHLLKSCIDDLSGQHAVIVGRSNIVGKPMSSLLLQQNCTVTIAHSRTKYLDKVCREGDVLIAAVGRPKMIKGNWIKPGATIIDVGINRIESQDGHMKLVGDVDYEEAEKVAGAITPVPGGVGPMTIACLLQNTLKATCLQNGITLPNNI